MKKFFVAGLVLFNALNIVAQSKNSIKFTAKIANRNSDTLVIKGRDNFRQVIPIDKKRFLQQLLMLLKGFMFFLTAQSLLIYI